MSSDKPKLLVIAGPNGSGKTSITKQILKHEWVEGCAYINPDDIAQHEFGDWNSPEAVFKAANDNSVDFAPAKLLFRSSEGQLEKTYAACNEWASSILNSLPEK